jgi:Flp pilus assembly protein TadD
MDDPGPILRQWLAEGLSHQRDGNYASALLAYRRVVSRDPNLVDAWCNMGSVLRELGRKEEALQACEQALELDPASTAALCNLGCLKGDTGEFETALGFFLRILDIQPDHFLAHFQMGWILFSLDRLEEALSADDHAIALDPSVAAAHLNRGYTLMKMGRLAEAEASFLQSLERDPGLALAHWNLAFLRLLDGRYREAWPDYAWRTKIRESLPSQRNFAQPLWEGERLDGKTILVWAEQGFGDTIQFVRYLPRIQARGGRVILQVQPALMSLMSTCPGADLILGEHQTPPPFDLQVPILSLPQIFDSTMADLPRGVPYLACPCAPAYSPKPALEEALREEGCKRIGLAWHGNPNQKDNRTRSLDPALLEPLAQLPGITWFSLQKYAPGVETKPLPEAFQARDLGPHLDTFTDTAYALERLHLLISVDTAVAHLAGAMARPAIVLLSFSPDWRWRLNGEDCPWYPTFKLYRQPRPGDWASAIQQLLMDFM